MFGKRGQKRTDSTVITPTTGKEISVAQFLISCFYWLTEGDTPGAIFGLCQSAACEDTFK